MVVFTEVSSMKTRLDESSRPCCRIQRRRARATSARSCSAARRLFFEADAVALQKPPKRAAAAAKPSLAQGRDELVERPVRLLGDQSQDLVRVALQRRPAPAARLWRASALLLPRLKPLDRRAGTDIKTFRRLTPRCSLFNCLDHTLPQIRRTSLGHGPPPKAESPPKTLPLRDIWESRFKSAGTDFRPHLQCHRRLRVPDWIGILAGHFHVSCSKCDSREQRR